MKKAVVYPFDKISRGMIRFRHLLDFEITGVIDFTFENGQDSGRIIDGRENGILVGSDADAVLNGADMLVINMNGVLMSKDELMDFNIEELMERWRNMLFKAHETGVEIVFTNEIYQNETKEWLAGKGIDYKVFRISRAELQEYIKKNYQAGETAENLCKIAVFGVHGCMGKFTAQMELLSELLKVGKSARAFVSEPTGFLFNQPTLANVQAGFMEISKYIQAVTSSCIKDGTEYLIYADQGGLGMSTDLSSCLTKVTLLMSFMPDIVILVVDYEDDIQIQKCMDIIKLYTKKEKVFAFLLPDRLELSPHNIVEVPEKDIERRMADLREKFDVENILLISGINELADKLVSKEVEVA